MKRVDPYAVAEFAFNEPGKEGTSLDYRLRCAVTAALIAERRGTLAYWLCRLRQRVIWFGGWERPNCGGFEIRRGGKIADVTPITIAKCFTHYRWGWDLKLPGTILVWSPRSGGLYLSPDGTPRSATRWIIGKPWAGA